MGRTIASEKKQDDLWKIWNEPMSKDEIKKKMMSEDKRSIRDVFIWNAFFGNERYVMELFKKLYPELVQMNGAIELKELTNIFRQKCSRKKK